MNQSPREDDRIRLVVVDDHAIIRRGLYAVFGTHRNVQVVGDAATLAEAVKVCRATQPDVVLIDLRLRNESGVDVIRALAADGQTCRTVVFTSFGSHQYIHDAIAAGAMGFVLKHADPSELAAAVQAAHAGQRFLSPEAERTLNDYMHHAPLSPRETDVLRLLIPGHRNHFIARVLGIAEETVKIHVKRILIKLGVKDRTEAVARAIQRGLVDLD
jgi:two-component system, NarL family, response regulator